MKRGHRRGKGRHRQTDGRTDRQIDRQTQALAEVRWEGADGTADSLRSAPLSVINHITMEH